MENIKKMKYVGADIDLNLMIYSLVQAVATGFNVDRDKSIDLIIKGLQDKRNNILDLITEYYELERAKKN